MAALRRMIAVFAALGGLALAAPANAESLEVGNAAGMCLDFSNGQGELARCDGGKFQDLRVSGNGFAEMRVAGQCVTDVGQGQPLILARCRNRTEQTWYLDGNGALISGTRLCADAERRGTSEGTRVLAFKCSGASNQKWRPSSNEGPSGGDYQTALLTPRHAPGLCLDLNASGSDLIIFGCHGKSNQQFSFTTYGETEIQVKGNCVTAPNSTGQSLYVARCTGSYQQRWNFRRDGTIRSASGYCADVRGASRQQTTPVILFKCSGNANQRWDTIYR